MEYVILDLEWNGTYSRRKQGFINEIIEFGAVKCDESMQIIDTFSALVKPQVGKKISGKVKSLTSITNEELAGGSQFMQVQSRFRKWMGQAVLLTWGTSDILTLIENYQYFCGSDKIPFPPGMWICRNTVKRSWTMERPSKWAFPRPPSCWKLMWRESTTTVRWTTACCP